MGGVRPQVRPTRPRRGEGGCGRRRATHRRAASRVGDVRGRVTHRRSLGGAVSRFAFVGGEPDGRIRRQPRDGGGGVGGGGRPLVVSVALVRRGGARPGGGCAARRFRARGLAAPAGGPSRRRPGGGALPAHAAGSRGDRVLPGRLRVPEDGEASGDEAERDGSGAGRGLDLPEEARLQRDAFRFAPAGARRPEVRARDGRQGARDPHRRGRRERAGPRRRLGRSLFASVGRDG